MSGELSFSHKDIIFKIIPGLFDFKETILQIEKSLNISSESSRFDPIKITYFGYNLKETKNGIFNVSDIKHIVGTLKQIQ